MVTDMADSNITIISSASEASDCEEAGLQNKKAGRNTRSRGSSNTLRRPSRSRRFSPAKRNIKHFVEHNYHDHAHDPLLPLDNESDFLGNHQKEDAEESVDENKNRRRGGHRGGVAVPFPEKLHYMLSQMEKNETSHIVNWQPHGRCFVVHKPKEFVEDIMPGFFRQTKMTSFQRQLNLYGFARLTTGPDRGGYYHELFIRGRMDLCKSMIRTRVKGNGSKAASSPSTEPNFYTMEPCLEEVGGPKVDDAVMLDASNPDSRRNTKKTAESSSITSPVEHDDCMVQTQLTLLPVEDQDDESALLFTSPDNEEEIVLKLIEEGPNSSSGVTRSESWMSLPPASPASKNTSPIAHSISTSSSMMPAIVSPPELPKPLVSPIRTPGHDLFAPLIGTSMRMLCFDEMDDMNERDGVLHESEGLHSGDEVFFEGLPFHYLETKDFEDCLFVVGV